MSDCDTFLEADVVQEATGGKRADDNAVLLDVFTHRIRKQRALRRIDAFQAVLQNNWMNRLYPALSVVDTQR